VILCMTLSRAMHRSGTPMLGPANRVTLFRATLVGGVLALVADSLRGQTPVLTIVAWIGKQACSLGVLQRGVDRWVVGLGMVPRGEVGLIFANIGATLSIGGERVITPPTYAAVVCMVILTTLVTPPALQWAIGRRERNGRVGAGVG